MTTSATDAVVAELREGGYNIRPVDGVTDLWAVMADDFIGLLDINGILDQLELMDREKATQ